MKMLDGWQRHGVMLATMWVGSVVSFTGYEWRARPLWIGNEHRHVSAFGQTRPSVYNDLKPSK